MTTGEFSGRRKLINENKNKKFLKRMFKRAVPPENS